MLKIALIQLLIATSAFAQDTTPDTQESPPAPAPTMEQTETHQDSQRVSDLQYFQPRGTFGITVGVSKRKSTSTQLNRKSLSKEIQRESLSESIDVAYGLFNFMTLNAGYTYYSSDREIVKLGSASIPPFRYDEYQYHGGTDPEFGLGFKILSQENNSVTVQAAIGYSPKTVGTYIPTTEKEGNENRVGDSTAIKLTVGQRFQKISYMASYTYRMFGAGDSTNLDFDTLNHASKYSRSSYQLSAQVPTGEHFAVRASIDYQITSSRSYQQFGYPEWFYDTAHSIGASTAFIFSLNNKIAFGLTAGFDRIDNQTLNNFPNSSESSMATSIGAWATVEI